MSAVRRTLFVAWPIVLLGVFVTTFRRVPTATTTAAATIDCDRAAQASTSEERDLPLLERCVTLDPANVELMSDLGATYEACKRWADAEKTYRRALAVDPRDSGLHVRLGALLLRRGDRDAANAEAQAALQWHLNYAAAMELAARASAGADR